MSKITIFMAAALVVIFCGLPEAATRADESSPRVIHLKVTAYTSVPEETDETPFVTAMGTTARDGVVATNLLPFKTKIKIPSLFGDKIFTVEDRMSKRITNTVDVWMPTEAKALAFGVRHADVVVVE